MKKQEFIDTQLDKIIENDKDIKKYFNNAQSEEEKTVLKGGLKQSLENAYHAYAKEYFDNKGLGSYLSKFLRWTGAAADAVGTYAFWALGGAGFGFKGVGLAEKTLADLIDNRHYEKYRKTDSKLEKHISKDGLGILGEGIAERAAAYLPLGVGELADLVRGTKKYDSKILLKALYHAKNDFIKTFGDYKPVKKDVIPLDNFRNPHYATIDNKVRKAA